MKYSYQTTGTCSSVIDFDLTGDVVSDIHFTGGCNGNLKAIARILDGTTVDFIEDKCRGNLCRNKGTSCADQLAIAVLKAREGSLG